MRNDQAQYAILPSTALPLQPNATEIAEALSVSVVTNNEVTTSSDRDARLEHLVRLAKSWGTASKPVCRCGASRILQDRAWPEDHVAWELLCGTWKCAICGPFLKKQWTEHVTTTLCLKDSARITASSKKQWDTIYKQIQRDEGQYFKVDLGDGYLIVTSADVGHEVSALQAETILTDAIRAVPYAKNITNSREWARPESDKKGRWKLVTDTDNDLETIHRVVAELDLQHQIRKKPTGEVSTVRFTVPSEWIDTPKYQDFIAVLISDQLPELPGHGHGFDD